MSKSLIQTNKIPVSKIDKIILPNGKILDAEGKPTGKYRTEFVGINDNDKNHMTDALLYALKNMKK